MRFSDLPIVNLMAAIVGFCNVVAYLETNAKQWGINVTLALLTTNAFAKGSALLVDCL